MLSFFMDVTAIMSEASFHSQSREIVEYHEINLTMADARSAIERSA
jgi:hypothetical protein